MTRYNVASTDEFDGDGERILVEVDGLEIAVFRVDGEYYALTNYCVHQGGPLCEGKLTGKMSVGDDGVSWEYEEDERYALTGFGRLAWQRHDDYIARLGRLDAGRRLIETLPNDRQLPPTLIEHGRIAVPGRHAPERPLDRLTELGDGAGHLRVLSPSGMPRFLADVHANVEAGEQTATIVTEADAIARLQSSYERFEAAAAEADLDFYSVSGELPYAIVLFDSDTLGLFGYEDGLLVGAAFTDCRDGLAWGERTFECALSKADRI
jgi:hypothetical protein